MVTECNGPQSNITRCLLVTDEGIIVGSKTDKTPRKKKKALKKLGRYVAPNYIGFNISSLFTAK